MWETEERHVNDSLPKGRGIPLSILSDAVQCRYVCVSVWSLLSVGEISITITERIQTLTISGWEREGKK